MVCVKGEGLELRVEEMVDEEDEEEEEEEDGNHGGCDNDC